jgi:hypothetical protein
VPLISSSCKGPLGIIHLPRLWWKRILDESGKLQDGYRCSALGGFDGSCANALGLDRDAFDRWLRQHRPTYLAVEAYVREHAPPETLTLKALRTFNERILGYDIRSELAEARRDRFAQSDVDARDPAQRPRRLGGRTPLAEQRSRRGFRLEQPRRRISLWMDQQQDVAALALDKGDIIAHASARRR